MIALENYFYEIKVILTCGNMAFAVYFERLYNLKGNYLFCLSEPISRIP